MKRLLLNRRLSELQSHRLRTRRIALLGLPAVEALEYAALDQQYNHPTPRPPPRITAKMKQTERKRAAHLALLEREKLEREARLQAMDEASRAAARAEEEERVRKREARDLEKAAKKAEKEAKRDKRKRVDDDDDADEDVGSSSINGEKRKKVAVTPVEKEAALRSQLESVTEALTQQNLEKVQLFEALKHVLNRENRKKAAAAAAAAPAATVQPKPTQMMQHTSSSASSAPPQMLPQKPRMGMNPHRPMMGAHIPKKR